jgi:hypothetical protein
MAALTPDNVLVWLHGRRIGLLGDAQGDNVPSGVAGLVVDGVVFGINLPSGRGLIQMRSANPLNAAGAVTLTGAQVGDRVLSVEDITSHTNVTANYESTISVVNQIQQTAAGTAADTIIVTLQPQS